MSFAFGIAVAAVGLALIYIGWKDIAFHELWQGIVGGTTPKSRPQTGG